MDSTSDLFSFNYSVSNQTRSQIHFQLQFANPDEISAYLDLDLLVIDILRPTDIFKSAISLKPVKLDMALRQEDLYYRVFRPIPPPLSTDDQQIIDPLVHSFNEAFNGLLIQSGLSSILIRLSLHRFWSLVRTGQLITFSSMIQIPIPAHVLNFLIQMFYMAEMDVLNSKYFSHEIFDFKVTEPVYDNLKFFSIVDTSFIDHSGSVLSMMILVLLGALVLWIAHKIARRFYRFKCCRGFGRLVYHRNYFILWSVESQKLYVEAYFVLALYTLISLHSMARIGFNEFYSTVADSVSSILTWLFLALAILYPLFSAVFIKKNFGLNRDFSSKVHLGALVDNNHNRTLACALNEVVYMSRRLATMCIILFIHDLPWLQTQLFVVLSVGKLGYQIVQKPMKTKNGNRIKLLNELCVYVCMMMFMQFCDPAGTNHETKHTMGWVLIILICVVLILNAGFVLIGFI